MVAIRFLKLKKLVMVLLMYSLMLRQLSGKFDRLRLRTDHVNLAVEKGKVLKLSAEVDRVQSDGVVKVKQMVIFIPSAQGNIPVWLMSKSEGKPNFKREKYLKMHAPNSDYTVF